MDKVSIVIMLVEADSAESESETEFEEEGLFPICQTGSLEVKGLAVEVT